MQTLILAVIAIVIGYRLYKILGDTSIEGVEEQNREPRVITMAEAEEQFLDATINHIRLSERTKENLIKIHAYITQEEAENFLVRCFDAFKYITSLYSNQEKELLERLTEGAALVMFNAKIDAVKARHAKEIIAIVGVNAIEIVSVSESGGMASFVLECVTEQISYTLDNSGEIISGSKTRILQKTETWTFSKPTSRSHSIWKLIDVS